MLFSECIIAVKHAYRRTMVITDSCDFYVSGCLCVSKYASITVNMPKWMDYLVSREKLREVHIFLYIYKKKKKKKKWIHDAFFPRHFINTLDTKTSKQKSFQDPHFFLLKWPWPWHLRYCGEVLYLFLKGIETNDQQTPGTVTLLLQCGGKYNLEYEKNMF